MSTKGYKVTSLKDALSEVRDRIGKYRGRSINEQNTKSTLIDPVLRALGWDLEDLEVVQREYRARKRDNPVDYALFSGREPVLFVEAKALGQDLNDRKWAGQVIGYASVAGAPWVVVTNGDEYRIYNAHAAVSVDRKLFRTVRVTGSGDAAQSLSLLQRTRMAESGLELLWQSHFVDQEVRASIEELFGTGVPDDSLVSLVRKRTKGLSARDVKASLARVRVGLDFPPDAVGEVAKRDVKVDRATSRKAPSQSDLRLIDLINAGLIRPPLVLHKTFKGKEFKAQVEVDGTVTFQGRRYNSLSEPAGAARKTIIGAPKGKKIPPTNGWIFWHFRDNDGKDLEMAELRERLVQRGHLKIVG